MIVTVIGIGLIGGSLALSLKEAGLATHIIGVDQSFENQTKALSLNLVDEVADLASGIGRADLIVLAVPMDAMLTLLPQVLDSVADHQMVIDVGSTKQKLLATVGQHPRRARFVAVHPMAGTEYSGPEAAVQGLFQGKTLVICDAEHSDSAAVTRVGGIFEQIGMRLVYMGGAAHDLHTAYISHISHITSFALALTVLNKEKEEQQIFDLASGGFESTVRLAKSSPDMWVPIFRQNRLNVLDVLSEHLRQLQHMKDVLEQEDYPAFHKLIEQANLIRKILK